MQGRILKTRPDLYTKDILLTKEMLKAFELGKFPIFSLFSRPRMTKDLKKYHNEE